jgi:V/A-type H+-transporting ATPase subunit A
VAVDRIASLPLMRRLRRMGEEIGEDELERFGELTRQVDDAFDRMAQEEGASDAG